MSTLDGALPDLRITKKLGGDLADISLYDVKFYPYNPPGVDPVFAVTGGRHTLVCRPITGEEGTIEDLRYFEEQGEEDPALNSLAWSRAEGTGAPLVCVSGISYQIKVLDVITGSLVKTLVGHGGAINDLATSPVTASILASASEDHSVRLWNLGSERNGQPCVAILAGEGGHKAGVLTAAFHASGKFLLSGGFDARVNLWVLPDLPTSNASKNKAITVHYPHFSTQEVHSDYVDCVSFYGDFVVSRSAKENTILIWKIIGFSSQNPPPPHDEAPSARGQAETRSAFSDCTPNGGSGGNSIGSSGGGGFQVLLTLAAPGTELFYMRFGLFSRPGKHPVLAMGHGPVVNEHGRMLSKSCVLFWDLQLLEDGIVGHADSNSHGGGTSAKAKARSKGKARAAAAAAAAVVAANSSSTPAKSEREPGPQGPSSQASTPMPMPGGGSGGGNDAKPAANGLKGPFHPLFAHKLVEDPMKDTPQKPFVPRAVSWSPGGEWCVVVGDNGGICALDRWEAEREGVVM